MATPGMDTQPTSPRTEIDLMTEQELARHLKICRRQLYTWRMAGLIPYFKMGKAVRIPGGGCGGGDGAGCGGVKRRQSRSNMLASTRSVGLSCKPGMRVSTSYMQSLRSLDSRCARIHRRQVWN